MSRLVCVENIFDTLVDAGLSPEHASFDDLVLGCTALVDDPAKQEKDIVSVIADMDESRSDVEIALDLKDYAYACGYKDKVVDLVRQAVAAGKAGWSQ